MSTLSGKYGPYAIVTGASGGIGAEFARQLAGAGIAPILVARSHDRLAALARELGGGAEVVALDLTSTGAVAELAARTAAFDVGLVVINAGIAHAGPFLEHDEEDERAVVALNVLATMQLAHHYGALLRRRGRGGLILLSSTIAHAPAPYLANYAATKAYVASLGQALGHELRSSGVDVLTLAPGPTRTPGTETADGIDFTAMPVPMGDSARVVATALRALGRKPLVIPGALNRLLDLSGKHLVPRRAQTRMFGTLIARALDQRPAAGTD